MKLAVERRAFAAAAAVDAEGPPPLVVAAGRAVESLMLSVAVDVLVGEAADARETSLFERLKADLVTRGIVGVPPQLAQSRITTLC